MNLKLSLIAGALLFSTASFTPVKILCQGFLPENDMKIPVTTLQSGGLTEAEFNGVLDKIQAYYAPVIARMGGTLHINRLWTDATVNASAERNGSTWVLNMYGGLARLSVVTPDTFMIVACHETGHHLGGAPKVGGFFGFNDWASNEGEADYYANLNCLRFLMNDRDNADFVASHTIDPVLQAKCETIYSNIPERDLCMRAGTAGLIAGQMFQLMRKETVAPKFDTPDRSVVSTTNDNHPATQCRLDTYYAGTVCFHDLRQPLSDSDPNQGTCSEAQGQRDGVRPRCWFKP